MSIVDLGGGGLQGIEQPVPFDIGKFLIFWREGEEDQHFQETYSSFAACVRAGNSVGETSLRIQRVLRYKARRQTVQRPRGISYALPPWCKFPGSTGNHTCLDREMGRYNQILEPVRHPISMGKRD